MIRFYPGEKFRQVEIDYPLKNKYAVSDRGRLISYTEKFEDGRLLKGHDSDGYKTLRYVMRNNGKAASKNLFVFRLIADLFIPKTSEDQCHVLHLDHSRSNDNVSNLKWATYAEMMEHRKTSPHVIRSKRQLQEHNRKSDGRKLTITKVIHLKKLLQDPNRKTRLKMLAKQFGISEMQVSRIKNGENWGRIKV
jgi:hypothetical protein